MRPKGNVHKSNLAAEEIMARNLDDLAEFEEFKNTLLPAVRKDLSSGMSAKDILKKYAAIAAARTVTIAALEVDSGKALAAAKDIIDRAEGKPKEAVTHTHIYENLTDDELDAQILSRAEEVGSRALAKSAKDSNKH